jgi:hypothetical protein
VNVISPVNQAAGDAIYEADAAGINNYAFESFGYRHWPINCFLLNGLPYYPIARSPCFSYSWWLSRLKIMGAAKRDRHVGPMPLPAQ